MISDKIIFKQKYIIEYIKILKNDILKNKSIKGRPLKHNIDYLIKSVLLFIITGIQ